MASRTFRFRGEKIEVAARRQGGAVILVESGGDNLEWSVQRVGSHEYVAREPRDDAHAHTVFAVRDRDACWIHLDGRTYRLENIIERGGGATAPGSLAAPIPATVQEVLVANGDAVEEGQVLLVLSAMKMQLEIRAPNAGVVGNLRVEAGDQVDGGAEILTVVEATAGGDA
jgi:biotin carboxyl carrier protein